MTDFLSIDLDFSELTQAASQIETAAAELHSGLVKATEFSVEKVRDVVSEYPEQSGDYHLHGQSPPPFYSPKQKRFVLAGIRNGTIIIPYPRTNQHANAWEISGPEDSGDTIQASVQATDGVLSKYLHSSTGQASMFSAVGNWLRIDQLKEKAIPFVNERFDTFILEFVSKFKIGG